MPKKIPVKDKREWLKKYEEGQSEASIARDARKNIKAVKRGIEWALRERDSSAARTGLIKEALHKHQNQLLGVIHNVLVALVMPAPDLALDRRRDGSLMPVQLSGATISYNCEKGLVLELDDEKITQWELLKEHLRRDPIWKMIELWKEAMIAHIGARTGLKLEIQQLLKSEAGYKLVETTTVPPFMYLNETVSLLYRSAIDKALQVVDVVNLQEYVIADTTTGQVRYRNSLILAEAPGEEEKYRKDILDIYAKLEKLEAIDKVANTYNSLVESTAKARRAVEEISLLGYIPGNCRVCRRLGM